jgi:sulfite dehydrogenase (quinone) subunit SoeC
MKPAYSVVFLTTLIGAGQGLFLALYGGELAGLAPGGGWR